MLSQFRLPKIPGVADGAGHQIESSSAHPAHYFQTLWGEQGIKTERIAVLASLAVRPPPIPHIFYKCLIRQVQRVQECVSQGIKLFLAYF